MLDKAIFNKRNWQRLKKGARSFQSPESRSTPYRLRFIFIISGLGCFWTPSPGAQTLPPDMLDAQHIQRQQQQQQFLQSLFPSPDNASLTPAVVPPYRTRYPAGIPCFRITSVNLTGESAQRFAWALNSVLAPKKSPMHLPSPIGQCLGVQGIALLTDHLQNTIMAAGYVTTRVLVGSQNIANGHLQLSVIPGRVQDIRFTDSSDSRARRWNALPVGEGEILCSDSR